MANTLFENRLQCTILTKIINEEYVCTSFLQLCCFAQFQKEGFQNALTLLLI